MLETDGRLMGKRLGNFEANRDRGDAQRAAELFNFLWPDPRIRTACAQRLALSYSADKKTLAYKLGEALSAMTDHYLLMTATPHKGDPENFLWACTQSAYSAAVFFASSGKPTHSKSRRRIISAIPR
jgi:hypothetical protein